MRGICRIDLDNGSRALTPASEAANAIGQIQTMYIREGRDLANCSVCDFIGGQACRHLQFTWSSGLGELPDHLSWP